MRSLGSQKFEGQICVADFTCECFQIGIVETLLLCASCDFIGWLRPQGANDSTGQSHERFRPSCFQIWWIFTLKSVLHLCTAFSFLVVGMLKAGITSVCSIGVTFDWGV